MNRLAIFVSLLLAGYPARAGMCPHGNDLGDGCPQANQNAVFQTPHFFTCTATWYCALAPGQAPYTALPTWNLAGVDYPVGYDKTLTLKDPTTSALPPGCSYNGSITKPEVNCSGTTGLDLEGYDFGNTTWGDQTTGNGCVELVVHGNVSGAIVIKNNRWSNGPDKVHGTFGCGIENSIIAGVYTNSVADSLMITNNICGINAENGPAPDPNGVITCFGAIMTKPGATIDAEYNAVFVAYGRFFELTIANGTKTLSHNYGEGLGYRSGALHGEFEQGGADGSCSAVVSQSYNTVLQPHDGMSGTAGVTAMLYGSSGAVGPCYASYTFANNTLIVNNPAATGIEVSYNAYTNLAFSNNYIAPVYTVRGGCIYKTSNPSFTNSPTFYGNINMLTGNTIAQFESCP
jgi:hypothetical protein